MRFAGGVGVEQATPGALALSLDNAIERGLKNNLQVQLANETERAVKGEILAAIYALLPNLKAKAYTQTTEIDLAAMGFKPSSLKAFGLPAGSSKRL